MMSMKSAVTISLIPQTRGGPFVFWDDLWGSVSAAAELGFDAVELFAPGPDVVDDKRLAGELAAKKLRVSAVGTGAGWVIHKLSLTSPDATTRRKAIDFIRTMIDWGAVHSAPAILGSMQGRWGDGVEKPQSLAWLGEALRELGAHATSRGAVLLYEPLNRYETNLLNRLDEGTVFLKSEKINGVKLLADLFHMNIEEVNSAAALTNAGSAVGHIHFVDSNRRAAGYGQMDFPPIIAALKAIGYQGYLSAEAFPLPDSLAAAKQTIASFRRLVG
jgi:sugar phosphate isomerase/epimerase